ncbi:MAG TPA: protein kinase [Bryobacteraceae bacterium]|nr:protein kinase [Bryobacteraceae bacterium]
MTTFQTLAERISGNRLPAAEALQLAVSIAERLTQWHARGECHGALTPSAIKIAGSGLELRAPAEFGVTAYTAPEVVLGETADKRSDIFSFGVIVYELFTGTPAFAEENPEALVEALLNEEPKPYGNVLVDRLLARCMAKSPEGRFISAQRLQLELWLLSSAARRGAAIVPHSPAASGGAALTAVSAPAASAAPADAGPSEIQVLETRMAARLEDQERSIASVERIASELLKAVREGGLPAARGADARPERRFADYDDPAMARLDRAFALLSEKVSRIDLAVTTALERLQKFEESLDVWDGDAAALRDSVTRDVRGFERTLKTQGAALDSVRTAMSQTDDLVERVVEALDSLQSTFSAGAEERKAS